MPDSKMNPEDAARIQAAQVGNRILRDPMTQLYLLVSFIANIPETRPREERTWGLAVSQPAHRLREPTTLTQLPPRQHLAPEERVVVGRPRVESLAGRSDGEEPESGHGLTGEVTLEAAFD